MRKVLKWSELSNEQILQYIMSEDTTHLNPGHALIWLGGKSYNYLWEKSRKYGIMKNEEGYFSKTDLYMIRSGEAARRQSIMQRKSNRKQVKVK